MPNEIRLGDGSSPGMASSVAPGPTLESVWFSIQQDKANEAEKARSPLRQASLAAASGAATSAAAPALNDKGGNGASKKSEDDEMRLLEQKMELIEAQRQFSAAHCLAFLSALESHQEEVKRRGAATQRSTSGPQHAAEPETLYAQGLTHSERTRRRRKAALERRTVSSRERGLGNEAGSQEPSRGGGGDQGPTFRAEGAARSLTAAPRLPGESDPQRPCSSPAQMRSGVVGSPRGSRRGTRSPRTLQPERVRSELSGLDFLAREYYSGAPLAHQGSAEGPRSLRHRTRRGSSSARLEQKHLGRGAMDRGAMGGARALLEAEGHGTGWLELTEEGLLRPRDNAAPLLPSLSPCTPARTGPRIQTRGPFEHITLRVCKGTSSESDRPEAAGARPSIHHSRRQDRRKPGASSEDTMWRMPRFSGPAKLESSWSGKQRAALPEPDHDAPPADHLCGLQLKSPGAPIAR